MKHQPDNYLKFKKGCEPIPKNPANPNVEMLNGIKERKVSEDFLKEREEEKKMAGNFIDLRNIDSISMDFGFKIYSNGDMKPVTTVKVTNKNGKNYSKTSFGHSSSELQHDFAVILQLIDENNKCMERNNGEIETAGN